MKSIRLTRRQVLLGAGGVSVALPLLPSLLPRRTWAASATFAQHPRLVWLATGHGGAYESNMFPSPSLLTTQTALFPDHTISLGALKRTLSGADALLSPVLRAPATRLTDRLVGKMNVLYGLDIPFYIGHQTGGHMGNYARNDGNGGDGGFVQAYPQPTVDQIMAWSSSFYPDLGAVRQRAMVIGNRLSWNYSNPSAKTGAIEEVSGTSASLALFDKIFTPAGTPATTKPRAPVVDKVLESYKLLRNSSRRLSALDRQRLDDHMDRLGEIERRLTTAVPSMTCGMVQRPGDDAGKHLGTSAADWKAYYQLFNDVITVAFMCGSSRIAVLGDRGAENAIGYAGDWHQDVAHQWQKPDKQALLVSAYQKIFADAFLDLAAKLDVDETPGTSFLDNTLLVWSQESGMETHGSVSIPVVTFGSAGGFLKTGLFCDYRRTGNPASTFDPGVAEKQSLGLLYSQWLGTVLQAMRVPPAEFERAGIKGYGYPFLSRETWTPPYVKHYGSTTSRYFQMASDVLPGLKA
jgi:hypothetical protein